MGKPTNLAKLAARLDSSGNIPQTALAAGVAGNGPAFSAYAGATTSIGVNTLTKINFNTEEFDTNSNYDISTSRFQPTVAGYYTVDGGMEYSDATASYINVVVAKNGTTYKGGVNTAIASNYRVYVNCLVYLNGSTDYVEIYGFANKAGTSMAYSAYTYFQGCLVRAA